MKYKHEYMPMKAIGELFGTTSHKIGKWLLKIGLREKDGKPSNRAYSEGFIEQRFFNISYTYYWHTEKTVAELVKEGHELIHNPPEELISAYNEIAPPFTIQRNQNCYGILNGEGLIILTMSGENNAKRMEKFLNIAAGHPKFFEFFPKESGS